MRVEALAIALRPRLAAEAADLGVALARAHARSVWPVFAPVYLVFLLLACATAEIARWLPGLLIFWCKPWLDCCLLFILSRAVFGQPTRLADLWQERATVWRGQWLRTLLWRRLSPWRAFTQPIHQLEGQRGQALRQRRRLLLNGQRGMATMMQMAFAHVEIAFEFALYAAVLWFAPQGHRQGILQSVFSAEASWWTTWLPVCIYAITVFVLEPFYVASGLAMYLNRRVELEAWDIEQEFRHVF
ncbi:MAG: hypothetical protein LBE78_01990 [Burkholderiaceae bacterium]|jgi:hypothetical protein|nr:hypothetical protein [Burkholderiaceae bacterium]